jgi:hypothetical protein
MVDCGGRYLNNIGGEVPIGLNCSGKIEHNNNYKFATAFESDSYPGYVTEKLLEPLAAGSIPIYCGGSQAKSDFNSKRFISVDDFPNYDQCIDWILHINQSPDLVKKYLQQPIFSSLPDWPDKVFDCLYHKMVAKNYNKRI